MAGDEAVEVVALQAEAGEVVPASHVFSGSGQAGNLAKDLEQSIVVEVEKAGVVLFELAVHRAVEQLHLRIGKGGKRSVNGDRAPVCGCPAHGGRVCGSPEGKRASRVGGSGGSGGGLEKSSAADTAGHRCLLCDEVWRQTFTSQLRALVWYLSTVSRLTPLAGLRLPTWPLTHRARGKDFVQASACTFS